MVQLWEGGPPSGVSAEPSWDVRALGESLSYGLGRPLAPPGEFGGWGWRVGPTLPVEFPPEPLVLQSTCHTWLRTKGLEVTWSNSQLLLLRRKQPRERRRFVQGQQSVLSLLLMTFPHLLLHKTGISLESGALPHVLWVLCPRVVCSGPMCPHVAFVLGAVSSVPRASCTQHGPSPGCSLCPGPLGPRAPPWWPSQSYRLQCRGRKWPSCPLLPLTLSRGPPLQALGSDGVRVTMESALTARDRVGVQDFVLLENFTSEAAFIENLRRRFRENLIYVRPKRGAQMQG